MPRLRAPPFPAALKASQHGSRPGSPDGDRPSAAQQAREGLGAIRMALAVAGLLLAAKNVGLLAALLKPGGSCPGLAYRLVKLASLLTLHPQGTAGTSCMLRSRLSIACSSHAHLAWGRESIPVAACWT